MRSHPGTLITLALCALAPSSARAELPLPDATLYGKLLTEQGATITSGVLRGAIQRGGQPVLTATGEFRSGDGDIWYVLKIPMETSIGAPGPSGAGAREGDTLGGLSLDGKPVTLSAVPGSLRAGSVTRLDGTAEAGPGASRFIRGDCTSDKALDISDAVSVLGYLFLGTVEPRCLDACDTDANKILELTDAVNLLQHLFLGGPAPPPPGPACAEDPTGGALGCAATACV